MFQKLKKIAQEAKRKHKSILLIKFCFISNLDGKFWSMSAFNQNSRESYNPSLLSDDEMQAPILRRVLQRKHDLSKVPRQHRKLTCPL